MKSMLKPNRTLVLVNALALLLAVNPAAASAQQTVKRCVDIKLYDKSYALLIGVSDYRYWPKLSEPTRDIQEVRKVLEEKHGFETQTLINPSRLEMSDGLRKFVSLRGSAEESRLLVYYAGSSYVSPGSGETFLAPRDALQPSTSAAGDAAASSMISLSFIEGLLQQIQSKHVMFVFDSAIGREGVITRGTKDYSVDLMATAPAREFLFSAGQHEVVSDKSGFSEALVEGLNGAGDLNKDGLITGYELADFVRQKVVTHTQGMQYPAWGKFGRQLENSGTYVFSLLPPGGAEPNAQNNLRGTRIVGEPETSAPAPGPDAGTYYALLISVKDYQDPGIPKLTYPISDAERLEKVLVENYTFDKKNVTHLINPSRKEITDALDDLQQKLKATDNVLIFFAGHGYWDTNMKQGYWWSSKADSVRRSEWLSNGDIRDYLRGLQAKHVLLISDACFSGAIFVTRDPSAANSPVSEVELYKLYSRRAITSGAMEQVPDKSVFVDYLIKRLGENQDKYLRAQKLFVSIQEPVTNNSQSKQVPQYGALHMAGDEGGDFIFVRRPKSISLSNSGSLVPSH
jgi:uncharacterized caspase-like protein